MQLVKVEILNELEKLDPTGYRVNGISAPTDVELKHHYLWRFAKEMPRTGHIELFDRSWYGRVLVERVEGFASIDEWQRAYDEINAFEKCGQMKERLF